MTLTLDSIPAPVSGPEHGRWLAALRWCIRSAQHQATMLTENAPYLPTGEQKVVELHGDDAEQDRKNT